MTIRRVLTALGTGLTTAILIAVVVTQLLAAPIEFSAILGLPIGLLAGVLALLGVLLTVDRFDRPVGRALGGYAAFGYAVLACMALRYVNVADARQTVSLYLIVLVAPVAAVAVFAGLWTHDERSAR